MALILGLVLGCNASEPAPVVTPVVRETRWFRATLSLRGAHRAWERAGLDLDGRVTTADASRSNTNVCLRAPKQPNSANTDGPQGIDNNFGQHVVQAAESLGLDLDAAVSGAAAIVIRLDDWPPVDADHGTGTLFLTTPDGLHVYEPGGIALSRTGYRSFEVPDTLGPLVVPVPLGDVTAKLELHRLRLVVGTSEVQIGAVLPRDSLFVPDRLNGRFCGVAVVPLRQAMEALDLVMGGAQLQDPKVPCDAISIGFSLPIVPTVEPIDVVPAIAIPPLVCDVIEPPV